MVFDATLIINVQFSLVDHQATTIFIHQNKHSVYSKIMIAVICMLPTVRLAHIQARENTSNHVMKYIL
jgi:hypothetical protein